MWKFCVCAKWMIPLLLDNSLFPMKFFFSNALPSLQLNISATLFVAVSHNVCFCYVLCRDDIYNCVDFNCGCFKLFFSYILNLEELLEPNQVLQACHVRHVHHLKLQPCYRRWLQYFDWKFFSYLRLCLKVPTDQYFCRYIISRRNVNQD